MLNIHTRPNLLTEDKGDYTAVVKHGDTLQIEDIAKIVMADFHGIDHETIIAIFKNFEHAIVRQLAEGNMVDTLLYHAMATVSGVFKGKNAHFNPDEGHRIGIALNICPPALKLIATGTRVDNLGLLPVGPEIDTVEDMFTHTPIGTTTRSLITCNRTLRVKGKNLRVSWDEEGTHATDCGIFLVKDTAPFTRTRVNNAELITNLPSELLFTVPTLANGTYWLEVVTQSSGGIKTLVKEPRTVRFEIPLEVENE